MSPDPSGGSNASTALDVATLASIVESSPDGIVVIGADGAIRYTNEVAGELFGLSREMLLGTTIESLMPERYRTEHLLDRREFMEDPRTRPMGVGLELRALHRDGHEFDVDVSLAPVRGGGESLVVAAVRDATERREAEADRRELLTSVERQVERERVAADVHDDLLQSVYAIGLGLMEALRDETVSKETALARAEEQVAGAIQDLRAYVRWLRAAEGHATGQQVASRLRALAQSGPQGLRWTSEFDFREEELPAEQLRHVYLAAKELVSNVHRHAEASEARLAIVDAGGVVEIRVEDDGCGFAMDAVGEGSFGLAGLRGRAESYGGELRVTSAPGEGTRVVARIPIVSAHGD